MTDLSPTSDPELSQIVATLGALPDAPMAMPLQIVEQPRRVQGWLANWLRPGLYRQTKAGR
jgi:hypothetical protein